MISYVSSFHPYGNINDRHMQSSDHFFINCISHSLTYKSSPAIIFHFPTFDNVQIISRNVLVFTPSDNFLRHLCDALSYIGQIVFYCLLLHLVVVPTVVITL